MRYSMKLVLVPLALVACSGGDRPAEAPDATRDFTTPTTPANAQAPVASALELGTAPPVKDSRPTEVRSPERPVVTPAPRAHLFTDDLDMPPQLVSLGPTMPVLGAGAGTVVTSGTTVTTFGPPVVLGEATAVGTSPWPEAHPGEYPGFDRSTAGTGLEIGSGGHGGACPRGGGRAFVAQFFPTR